MQRIVIKEIRGPLGKGQRKFYSVKDETGSEFTCFNEEIAKLGPGSVIEAEIQVKGKYINIPDEGWKVIESTPASTQSGPGTGGGGQYKRDTEGIRFEYELKAYLQSIERASIEGQTAYNGLTKVLELIAVSPIHEKYIEKLAPGLIKKALQYAESRLDLAMASKPPQSPKASPESKEARGTPKGKAKDPPPNGFANVGELLTWALAQDISRAQFLEITGATETTLAKLNLVDAKNALDDYILFRVQGDPAEQGGAGVK